MKKCHILHFLVNIYNNDDNVCVYKENQSTRILVVLAPLTTCDEMLSLSIPEAQMYGIDAPFKILKLYRPEISIVALRRNVIPLVLFVYTCFDFPLNDMGEIDFPKPYSFSAVSETSPFDVTINVSFASAML